VTDARDERALVAAWAGGDERAFEVVFRRQEKAIRRLCRGMLRDAAEAEEATQETFLKAWMAVGRTNGDGNLEAWLRRIARNVCLDNLRAKRRRPVASPMARLSIATTERGPEELIAGGDPRVETVLRRLAPQHRAAVELRFISGLSHVEMASALAKSPVQIKALVHRARIRLSHEWSRLASPA
jgi:RNA polymerase sigma-70 factor, ECF subfamily